MFGGIVLFNHSSEITVRNEQPEKVIDNTPEWAKDEDARKAAEAVIKRKALEAELSQLESEIDERQVRVTEIQKELGTFWKDVGRIKALIKQTFPGDHKTALAVAAGESEYNSRAYNPEWHYDKNGNKVCQGSYGLMQVACSHHIEDPEALYNPEFNVRVAFKIYQDAKQRRGNGWLPWGAYTDGRYLAYLQ